MIATVPAARRVRRGFTLIELLVVIAIIATLAALTLAAIGGVYKTWYGKSTETTIQKLASDLDRQWKAVVDNAKEEFRDGRVSPSLLSNYGGDPDTARRIWVRMRLQQEFPSSIAEATGNTVYPSPANALVVLGPKQSYVRNLGGMNPGSPMGEASACLYVALSEGRRGTLANPEESLGASSIRNINGAKIFVDVWGQPIAVRRNALNAIDWQSEIFSAGPDKIPNTNDDLSSLALRKVGVRGDAK